MHTCPLYSAFPLSQLPVYPAGCVFPASIRCRCGSISLKAFSSLWINGTVPQCTQALPVPPDQNTDAAPFTGASDPGTGSGLHKIFKTAADRFRPRSLMTMAPKLFVFRNYCKPFALVRFHHLQRKEIFFAANLRKHAVYSIIHPGPGPV